MDFQTIIPFRNRYIILNFFSKDISSNLYSTVSIIYSKSGVGKSRLCEEILKDISDTKAKVKVKVNISKSNSLQDGFYIKQLAKEINKNSSVMNSISFEEFLKIDSEKDVDGLLYKVANDYIEKSPLMKNAKDVVSKIFSFGSFESDKFFDSNISDTIKTAYDYIEYSCKNNYFIINVENIQNIDITSLEHLSKLIQTTDKIYLLLEYTISNNTSLSITDIKNSFGQKVNLNFHIKELDYLSENELVKLLESNNELLKQYVKRSYTQWDGNLRPFVSLHYKLPDSDEEIKNFISNSNNTINNLVFNDLLNLNTKEIFLLMLIAVHADPVELNLVNQIHNIDLLTDVSNIFDFELELGKLVQKRFLSTYNKSYMVNDDTILNILLDYDNFHAKKVLAVQLWLKIYTLLYDAETHYFTSKSSLLFNILNFSG